MSAQSPIETRPALREQRRDLPRIDVGSPVEVLVEDGDDFAVQLVNISRGGAQLGCSKAEAETMVLRGSLVSPDQGAVFLLRFVLPVLDNEYVLQVRGRLAHSTPIAKDRHAIGIQFLSFDGESQQHLEAFIEASLA